MRIAICDDSELDLAMISELMNTCFAETTSLRPQLLTYTNGQTLLDDVIDGMVFDVVFLDILMPVHLGIDVARKLRDEGFDGDIVFLTATRDFAVDSYDVNASGYILKPISIEKLNKVVSRIAKNYGVGTYPVRQRANVIQIPLAEILFIESRNNKCVLHRTNKTEYTVYKKLDEIEAEIKDKRFLRCHQSYFVNMDHIREVDRQFTLSTGDVVFIRQRNLKAIREAYMSYVSERRAKWQQD